VFSACGRLLAKQDRSAMNNGRSPKKSKFLSEKYDCGMVDGCIEFSLQWL